MTSPGRARPVLLLVTLTVAAGGGCGGGSNGPAGTGSRPWGDTASATHAVVDRHPEIRAAPGNSDKDGEVAVSSPPAPLRTRSPEDERRLESFERRMAAPIFVSAVFPIILSFAGANSVVASVVLVVTWFVFIADFVVHVRLIPGYLRSGLGLFDLGIVVVTAPWFLIPGMGDARFLSFARLARLARVMKASGKSLIRLANQLGRVGAVTLLLVVTCAYVAYNAEHPVNPDFSDYGQSVWWAIVTVTTVGYGDVVPITRVGRVTATVLMFSGLGLLGVLAGALASFFGFSESASEAEPEPESDSYSQSGGEPARPQPVAAVPPGDGTSAALASARAEITALRVRLAAIDKALADEERVG